MFVDKETIESIVVGAVDAQWSEDAVRFYRCTRGQLEGWRQIREDLATTAMTSTGIRMDFHTDARAVAFTVAGFQFDVLVDGLLWGHYVFPHGEIFEEIRLTFPQGDKRVTLIFPSHVCCGALKAMEVEDGAYVTPHTFDCSLLFMGDSITQGWASRYDCLSYAYRTSLNLNARSIINGTGGTFFAPSTFEKPDFDPDGVIVAYGTNDFDHYKTPEVRRENAAQFLQMVSQAYGNKKLFYISPIYRFDLSEQARTRFDAHREMLKAEAENCGFHLIDGYDLVPHMEDFYLDPLHPNDLGFGFYADRLTAELRKYNL